MKRLIHLTTGYMMEDFPEKFIEGLVDGGAEILLGYTTAD